MGSAARAAAIVGLGVRHVLGRALRGGIGRLASSTGGVAVAIGLMLVVSGVGVGLATQTTVFGSDVDYWIVPESSSASTMAVSVGGPRLGAVHETADRVAGFDGVRAVSPVAIEVLDLRHGDTSEAVLVLGVVPGPGLAVNGIPTDALRPGDPHYGDGDYEGPWTGEVVLSSAAASVLDASPGATVAFGSSRGDGADASEDRRFEVANVSTAGTTPGADAVPMAVVHLSELQSLTGGTNGDTADQLLVRTDDPGVRDRLAGVYDNTVVVSGSETAGLADSDLALAIAVTAVLVALVVGTLFVATTMGLEMTADRATYATLSAVGVSRRSQALMVVTQSLTVALLGGSVGVGLGVLGVETANWIATTYLTNRPVATFSPLLAALGLGTAACIGLCATPYLLWLTKRTPTLEQLSV